MHLGLSLSLGSAALNGGVWYPPSIDWFYDAASNRVWTGEETVAADSVITSNTFGHTATGFADEFADGVMFAYLVDVDVDQSFDIYLGFHDGSANNRTFLDIGSSGGVRLRQTIAGAAQSNSSTTDDQRIGKMLLVGVTSADYQAIQASGGVKRTLAQSLPVFDRLTMNGSGIGTGGFTDGSPLKLALKYGPFADASAEFDAFFAAMQSQMLPSSAIWFEGDSFTAGFGGVVMPDTLSNDTGRMAINSAVGGASMTNIRDRMVSGTYDGLRRFTTIIWDGDEGTIVSVDDYCDQLQTAVESLGHSRFIIIPPTPEYQGDATQEVAVRDEMLVRWPNNVLDWRDWIATTNGFPDDDRYINPPTDAVHLNQTAMDEMVAGIVAFLTTKGW